MSTSVSTTGKTTNISSNASTVTSQSTVTISKKRLQEVVSFEMFILFSSSVCI